MPKKSAESETTPEEAERLLAWLHHVVEKLGSRVQAARVAGITPQQLGRLLDGTSKSPSAITLARLAAASGVSLDDLLPAELPRLDGELLGRIMQRVAKLYREAGIKLDELELGRLAAAECNVAAGATPAEWPTVLRLVEARAREAIAKDHPARRTRRGA